MSMVGKVKSQAPVQVPQEMVKSKRQELKQAVNSELYRRTKRFFFKLKDDKADVIENLAFEDIDEGKHDDKLIFLRPDNPNGAKRIAKTVVSRAALFI